MTYRYDRNVVKRLRRRRGPVLPVHVGHVGFPALGDGDGQPGVGQVMPAQAPIEHGQAQHGVADSVRRRDPQPELGGPAVVAAGERLAGLTQLLFGVVEHRDVGVRPGHVLRGERGDPLPQPPVEAPSRQLVPYTPGPLPSAAALLVPLLDLSVVHTQ